MALSRDGNAQGKCKLVKCSRHFNQNGLISMDDRIYANSTTADECNYSRIPARLVLYFLSWSGFLVSFMMRNDINIALVSMVRQNVAVNNSIITTVNATDVPILKKDDGSGEFDWSTLVQSMILSSFYACYVLSQVAGGVATQYFGTKNVFGWSQFATAACSLCIPLASTYHYSVVILLRSVQGFASGLTWPAMYAVVSFWIPAKERSRFMSSFQGFSVGIGLTYIMCGFIINHFGWRLVFYTSGTIGMLWCFLWWLLAYNTPDTHPRISCHEYEYIQRNIDDSIRAGQGMHVPWKSIFTSLPVWSIGVTTFGRIWVHYTFIVGGPTYMKNIIGVDIQTNGFLTGAPFLCSYVSSVIFCWIADIMMKRETMSLTNIRKLFTILSQVFPGLLALCICYCDDFMTILVIWFISVTFITASYAGPMANIVDIAPNLAGPVLAFAQTIHMSASFLNPVVNGWIVTNLTDIDQWKIAFITMAIIACSTYFMFHIYGTSEIQKWNFPPRKLLPEANGIKPVIEKSIKISHTK